MRSEKLANKQNMGMLGLLFISFFIDLKSLPVSPLTILSIFSHPNLEKNSQDLGFDPSMAAAMNSLNQMQSETNMFYHSKQTIIDTGQNFNRYGEHVLLLQIDNHQYWTKYQQVWELCSITPNRQSSILEKISTDTKKNMPVAD